MFFEDDEKQYRLVAPDIDALLRYFESGLMNPTKSTDALLAAAQPLFDIVEPLAPLKKNDEVKAIWLRIPRGTIEDYDSFEEMKEYGEVDSYEEFQARWLEDYPEEFNWYRFVAVQSFNSDGKLRYYGISLGNMNVISATTEDRTFFGREEYYPEEAAIKLCSLIAPAVQESVELLRSGSYNDIVAASLPYQFRVGVVRRKGLWKYAPEEKKRDLDGLTDEDVAKFKELIASGVNDTNRIGRIQSFTANDFFRACEIGYRAIGKDCDGFTLPELYLHYSDGRDEGLTGEGHGLNAGPGIDFNDPAAWNDWYFNRKQHGGHPWEVVPGGNSTHLELYVENDKRDLEWKLRGNEISEEEYKTRLEKVGYYFAIAGVQRQFEAVRFYNALTDAGLPVIIGSAEELLARFEATDYVGVVPHHLPTRYCESLFPESYGEIIDFTHVYKGEDEWFNEIEWLPEEPAEVKRL